MNNSTIAQLYSLFVFAVSGIIVGIFFDVFRILRKSFKTPDFITYIEDIIFWIITGLFLLFVLFTFENGQIRSYNIIGLIIGVILYIFTISKYFIKCSVTIITFFKNIIYKILKVIISPLKMFFKPISFVIINVKNITKCDKKIKNNIKNSKKILRKEGF